MALGFDSLDIAGIHRHPGEPGVEPAAEDGREDGMSEAIKRQQIADRVEALADAWASIDGRLGKFRKGKTAKSITAYGGHYAGYMAEAEEMIERLKARGWRLVPVAPPKQTVKA